MKEDNKKNLMNSNSFICAKGKEAEFKKWNSFKDIRSTVKPEAEVYLAMVNFSHTCKSDYFTGYSVFLEATVNKVTKDRITLLLKCNFTKKEKFQIITISKTSKKFKILEKGVNVKCDSEK